MPADFSLPGFTPASEWAREDTVRARGPHFILGNSHYLDKLPEYFCCGRETNRMPSRIFSLGGHFHRLPRYSGYIIRYR